MLEKKSTSYKNNFEVVLLAQKENNFDQKVSVVSMLDDQMPCLGSAVRPLYWRMSKYCHYNSLNTAQSHGRTTNTYKVNPEGNVV